MFAFAKRALADDGESGELPARSITGPLIARPCRASSNSPRTWRSHTRGKTPDSASLARWPSSRQQQRSSIHESKGAPASGTPAATATAETSYLRGKHTALSLQSTAGYSAA